MRQKGRREERGEGRGEGEKKRDLDDIACNIRLVPLKDFTYIHTVQVYTVFGGSYQHWSGL